MPQQQKKNAEEKVGSSDKCATNGSNIVCIGNFRSK